jgi:hypothetical protein
MRIRADVDGTDLSREAFSQDILKIEISGRDVSYFSLASWLPAFVEC